MFGDCRAEEAAYYQRSGFYPIMHVLAIKPEVVDAHPEVALTLFDVFERAKEMAFHYYDDPNWSHLAWAAHLLQEEREAMGAEAWGNGLDRNRKNLERFIQYERTNSQDVTHQPSSHQWLVVPPLVILLQGS